MSGADDLACIVGQYVDRDCYVRIFSNHVCDLLGPFEQDEIARVLHYLIETKRLELTATLEPLCINMNQALERLERHGVSIKLWESVNLLEDERWAIHRLCHAERP